MESFRKLAIDAYDARSRKSAKDFLPSRNTIRKGIDKRLDRAKEEVISKLELLKRHGRITLDFAKKSVDYIAMTGHFIDENWIKQDFVLSFSPVEAGAKKTSQFVQ
uniref:Transposase n=1 Tax=Ditylenchus dipsaci TaxID=166011 RepID=A0A915E4A1_9BILA